MVLAASCCFYEEWKGLEANSSVPTDELQLTDNEGSEIHQLQLTNYTDFPIAAFMSIGFSHHSAIMAKAKTLEERKYYIQLCYDQHLKVEEIEQKIADDTFHKQGTLPNNFNQAIPDYKQAFQAIQMFKDEYLLDYINVEQLGERDEDIDDDDRLEWENAPLGIILCKDADKTFVEYVLQDYQRPMGVATYKTSQEQLKELLPDEEEMKKLL